MATRVCVVGATGYAGEQLCALLRAHPSVDLSGLYAGSGGDRAETGSLPPGPVERLDLESLLAARPDCVFLATHHDVSAGLVPALRERRITAIDLSGAYRLKDPVSFSRWYAFDHPAPRLLEEAIYGLTEWCDDSLAGRLVVANPGCYPTSVLLALRPLEELLDPDQAIVADCKSGVSGAGRRREPAYSFAELSGNFRAYGIGSHRHEPEIRQELGLSDAAPLVFAPHLLPVVRGILSTIHVAFRESVDAARIEEAYRAAYTPAPFVRALPAGRLPELKAVVGTPRAEIGFTMLAGGRRAVIVSVLDNLMKGAASQAVQNFNRVFGFAETEGLA